VKLEENFKLEEQIMSKDKYPNIFLMSNGGFKKKKKCRGYYMSLILQFS